MLNFISYLLKLWTGRIALFCDAIKGVEQEIGSQCKTASHRTLQAEATLGPVIFRGNSAIQDAWKHYKDEEGPFMICDVADIIRKFCKWKREMPRVEPFFAVKANLDPTILRILAALGLGFDCASKVEIDLILGLGVDASRIIYANTCKSPSHLRRAAEAGIRLLTFDNEAELHKIKEHHPHAQLVIRIKADEEGATHGLAKKFGCDLEEVPQLARLAKELHFEIMGVSFHIGVNNHHPNVFANTIASCKKVFEMAEAAGHRIKLLDLGGGFPGAKHLAPQFEAISSIVRKSLAEHFPPESGVRIIAEPGKFFVRSAITLYAQIIGKRKRGENTMYFINDGIYGSFHESISQHYKCHPRPLLESSECAVHPCSVWGPTCDSADRIWDECRLPDMRIGEWVAFDDMGAYALAAATTFNGFQKPTLKYILPPHIEFLYQKGCTWVELCNMLKEHIAQG